MFKISIKFAGVSVRKGRRQIAKEEAARTALKTLTLKAFHVEGLRFCWTSLGRAASRERASALKKVFLFSIHPSPSERGPNHDDGAVDIDRAEDREVFSEMLDTLNIDQPEWSVLSSMDDAVVFANKVSFPVLVRPSFVLSGAAMRVAIDESQLRNFLSQAADVAADDLSDIARGRRLSIQR